MQSDGTASQIRIGVDMGGNDIKFGATGLDATELLLPKLVKRPSLAHDGPDQTIGQMLDGIGAVLTELGLSWPAVADVSVTVPCPCSPTGTIVEATNLGSPETKALWQVPFGEHLASALQKTAGREIPVFACNDANAAGQDDDFVRHGPASGERTSVFVTTGTGLGGCVLHNGSVFYGLGQAGELGHVKPAVPEPYAYRFADDTEAVCGCGARQCCETRCALNGLTRRIQWALSTSGQKTIGRDLDAQGQRIHPEVVARLTELCEEGPKRAAYEVRTFADRDGDAFCRWLLEDWAIMIGALFASISPILHPNQYIIGGGLTEMSGGAKDWFIGVVRRVYGEVNSQRCFESQMGNCEIVWSVSEDQGWRGAILMAMRRRGE